MSIKLKNLHILVVEDLAPMRELTTSVLKTLGVGQVSYATDGENGFEAYRRVRPDIVMTDWQMPHKDGIELTKLIRTSPISPDKTIPIIMMTGYGSPLKISTARNAGATEFLLKPFSSNDIHKRIQHVIKSPRDFIVTKDYAGPDRRRKENDDVSGINKRTNPEGYLQKIKSNNLLQNKVGLFAVDAETLAKSQNVLDKNNFKFAPIALMFLAQLRDGLGIVKAEEFTNRRSIERLTDPVMQIKANARIFKFELLGDLASIMLGFLENMNELDSDSIAIVEAHHRTLLHIINDDLQGDGGKIGDSLRDELNAACKRYTNSRIARQQSALKSAMGN